MSDMRISRLVSFLTNLKSEAIIDGRDGRMIGGCGYLAAIEIIDATIHTLLEQQTQNESLEFKLQMAKDSEERARDMIEDFFGDREADSICEEMKEKMRKYVDDLFNGRETE